MKKIYWLIFAITFATFIVACSGDEKKITGYDKPNKPSLIPHLGNTGDDSLTTYYAIPKEITDENNGIDAFADGDWIQLRWEPIIDSNIEYIEIYRFFKFGILQEESKHTMIDKIDYDNAAVESYIDKFTNLNGSIATNKDWYYYLKIFNIGNKSEVSDTVSYKLMPKPLVVSPSNNSYVKNDDELVFEWDNIGQNHCRILLFDDGNGTDNYNLIWSYDWYLLEDSTPKVNYSAVGGSPIWNKNVHWRVDAIFSEKNTGAESNGATFYIGNE